MTYAAKLYEAANRAAADAMRWSREPNGEAIARIRRQDAETLRSLARSLQTT